MTWYIKVSTGSGGSSGGSGTKKGISSRDLIIGAAIAAAVLAGGYAVTHRR